LTNEVVTDALPTILPFTYALRVPLALENATWVHWFNGTVLAPPNEVEPDPFQKFKTPLFLTEKLKFE